MKKLLVFILVFSFAISMSACQLLMQEVHQIDREDGALLSPNMRPGADDVMAGNAPNVDPNIEETPVLTFDEMTTADYWEINTVLSHFVDTGLKSFDRSEPGNTDLFTFAVCNAYLHNYHKIKITDDGQYYYLTADDVSATILEYFDIAVDQPLAVEYPTFYTSDAYYWPCADGEMATEFACVKALEYNDATGLYEVQFDVFSPYDLFTMEIEGYYSFSHKDIAARDDLMHVGSGTALLSYKDGQCIIYSIHVAG